MTVSEDTNPKVPLIAERPTPYKRSGPLRALYAGMHAVEGIAAAWRYESSFRQETILACLMIPAAIVLPLSAVTTSLMVTSVLLVLMVELLNSAIEWAVDYISQKENPLAKRIKDMAAGAVFLALLNCGITWFLFILTNWATIREWAM